MVTKIDAIAITEAMIICSILYQISSDPDNVHSHVSYFYVVCHSIITNINMKIKVC